MEGKKTGGRQKGTPNKDTQKKELLLSNLWSKTEGWVTGEGLTKFKTELNSLAGSEYVRMYLQLLEYFKPKLARVDNAFPDSDEVEIIRIKKKPVVEKKS